MRMIKETLLGIFLVAMVILLSSWGNTGHNKISYAASLSYNQEMGQFDQWTSILAEHASDADIRKGWDPNEGPKHYIDIDNYSEFTNTGTIPQTLEEAIAAHSYNFVYDQGILPWATLASYDSLQSCFERGDWEQAVLFASDLGHYVADGHMPFHITRNYNGQYSGNDGIHSRYESDMINMFVNQINYQGYQVEVIDNVNQYIFDYLYFNYTFIDSVLVADDYSQNLAGNNYSTAYKTALWEQTEYLTTNLFKEASHSLTELIYTAWKNAGSPSIAGIFSPQLNDNDFQLQNSPNPFSQTTNISYVLSTAAQVRLEIIDISGNPVITLSDENKPVGEFESDWDASGNKPGVYYAVLSSGKNRSVCKMVLVD